MSALAEIQKRKRDKYVGTRLEIQIAMQVVTGSLTDVRFGKTLTLSEQRPSARSASKNNMKRRVDTLRTTASRTCMNGISSVLAALGLEERALYFWLACALLSPRIGRRVDE